MLYRAIAAILHSFRRARLFAVPVVLMSSLGLPAAIASLSSLGIVWASQAQATELEVILQRGYIVVGVKDNLRPLGYRREAKEPGLNSDLLEMPSASGNLVEPEVGSELLGFEIDLARQLAQAWFGDDTAVQFKPLANRDRLGALLSGEVDLLMAHLSVTGDRARLVQFSQPYYQNGIAVLTEQPNLRTLGDLREQRLAVIQDSSSIPLVQSRLPPLVLVPYPSYEAALAGLGRGEADAIAADAAVLAGWQQLYPTYRRLGPLLSVEPLAIALPKGLQHQSLRLALAQVLGQWQASGWLEQQRQRWQLF